MQPWRLLFSGPQVFLTLAVLAAGAALWLVRPGKKRTGATAGPALPRSGGESRPAGQPARTTPAQRLGLILLLAACGALLLERGRAALGVGGDSWGEAAVITAGQNFARLGLWTHYGVPLQQVTGPGYRVDPFYFYFAYPGGSSFINGLWQTAGITSLQAFRLLPAVCSLAALLVFFHLYRRAAGPSVALLAVAVMATSFGFLAFADNVDYHGYALLTSTAALACFVRALEPGRRRRWPWFLLTGVLMFVTAALTWDYHLFMLLFIGLYALLFPVPVRRGWLLLLILPLLLALALQQAQRRLTLAAMPPSAKVTESGRIGFLDDLYRRTLGFEAALDTPEGLTLGGYPAWLLVRYYRFYGLPLVAAAAVLVLLLARDGRAPWRVRGWRPEERWLVSLLVAGTGWWLFMLQHTAVHPRVMRHGLAGYALLLAVAGSTTWGVLRARAGSVWHRTAAAALLLLLAYPHFEGLICNLRQRYQPAYTDDRDRSTAGRLEWAQLSDLAAVVPEGAVILTNYNRLPLMRLAAGRPVYLGVDVPFPPNDPARARSLLELRFNHLRDIYADQLPPIYYVHWPWGVPADVACREDAALRILMLGAPTNDPAACRAAAERLVAVATGQPGGNSFCPLVARVGNYLVFQFDPAVPVLRELWGKYGFPTAREFGPPR